MVVEKIGTQLAKNERFSIGAARSCVLHGFDVLAFSEKAQLAVTAQFALAALFLCVGEQNQLC